MVPSITEREKSSRKKGNSRRQPESSRLLTAKDVSEITGLSVETLAQWRSQRKGIPFVKISRNCVRYQQSDLDGWLAERIVRTDEDPSDSGVA
jgi:predicted DNA-binding transcriptional regulator AlpA